MRCMVIRNMNCMSAAEGGKKLGVSPAQVNSWLEEGALKGDQRVSGTWKITQADCGHVKECACFGRRIRKAKLVADNDRAG